MLGTSGRGRGIPAGFYFIFIFGDENETKNETSRDGTKTNTERDGRQRGLNGMKKDEAEIEWDGIRSNGTKRDQTGESGATRDITGWNGMGQDGMGWDGMGWDGMGWDGVDEIGRDEMG